MGKKELTRYSHDGVSPSKEKEFGSNPLLVSDLGNVMTLATGGGIAAAAVIVAGDIVTGGIATGITLGVSALLGFASKRGRLKMRLAQIAQQEVALPKGSTKSLLPLAGRFFPLEFEVEALEPLQRESLNRRLSENDPRNMTKRSYLVKTVKGKTHYYELPSTNPVESWDVLFAQETGRLIDTYRPNAQAMYNQLDSRKTLDIATAKLRVALDKGQGKQTPIWIKELASQKLY